MSTDSTSGASLPVAAAPAGPAPGASGPAPAAAAGAAAASGPAAFTSYQKTVIAILAFLNFTTSRSSSTS
jgi:hypothetical protein